ncbi:MAG: T9SS type A sorting domain-containing protein [candidate division WOR-3 bacterium]
MKKLIGVCIIVFSLTLFGKGTFDFETEEQPFNGNLYEQAWCPISLIERSSDIAYEGNYSLKVVFNDPQGTGKMKWAFGADNTPLTSDLQFGDTVFFWVYLPSGYDDAMSSMQPFIQNESWGWHGHYQSWASLPKDEWHCNWCDISELTLPIIRAGIEFTSAVESPECTVYVDLVSSVSRQGGSGVNLFSDPEKITLEPSINKIKFSLDESAPILISVYNLTGTKIAEIAPGVMTKGTHEFKVEAPGGIYIVKLVAGKVTKKSKLIIFK